jgi:hypothetical protein
VPRTARFSPGSSNTCKAVLRFEEPEGAEARDGDDARVDGLEAHAALVAPVLEHAPHAAGGVLVGGGRARGAHAHPRVHGRVLGDGRDHRFQHVQAQRAAPGQRGIRRRPETGQKTFGAREPGLRPIDQLGDGQCRVALIGRPERRLSERRERRRLALRPRRPAHDAGHRRRPLAQQPQLLRGARGIERDVLQRPRGGGRRRGPGGADLADVRIDEVDVDPAPVSGMDEEELVALGHLMLDDRAGERREHVLLDRAPERARAHLAGEAPAQDDFDRARVPFHRPGAVTEPAALRDGAELLGDEPPHRLARERPEDDDAVEAVEELRAERGGERPSRIRRRRSCRRHEADGAAARAIAAARVGGEDHDAVAEVDRGARAVRHPRVVEEREEGVPDPRVGLLDLVEQHDRERRAADRVEEPGGLGGSGGREQPLEALRGLELAHVEPDEASRGAEQVLRQRLGQLRLAGAGRADEEEDPERPGRVHEPRLDHRDALDERAHRVRLAHHALREEGGDLGEVESAALVEDVEREAGQLRDGGQQVVGAECGRKPAILAAAERCADQPEHPAGRGVAGEVLAGGVDGVGHDGGGRPRAALLQPPGGHGEGLIAVEGRDPHRLRQRGEPRQLLADDRPVVRRGFRQQPQPAFLEVRHDAREHSARV